MRGLSGFANARMINVIRVNGQAEAQWWGYI